MTIHRLRLPRALTPSPKPICVFNAQEHIEPLAMTLSNIGYRTVVYPFLGGKRPEVSPDNFSAAIIADSVENPLQFAADISRYCPVLLLTQQETSIETRLAAARAGVHAVLARPLDISELSDWLNDLIGPDREAPLSVLIIDDDELVAETYVMALERAGMQASIETDPSAAFGRMTATYPDLVLMDMQMPGVSGMELAAIIRQSRRHLSLPIVFLSAERDPAMQLEARRLGGDDFITKPVDPEKLVSLVRMRADRAMRLRSMMERDRLTGLLNHGRFIDRLFNELERCRRTGAEISLVLIDVDRFKSVNDTHGHLVGDRVLQTLAYTLSSRLRRIDLVGRYGGEEFAAILLDAPPQAACTVIDKIRRRFSEIEFRSGGAGFSVTFSAGISSSRKHLASEDLIAAADRCMYQAKAAGRNRTLVELAP